MVGCERCFWGGGRMAQSLEDRIGLTRKLTCWLRHTPNGQRGWRDGDELPAGGSGCGR